MSDERKSGNILLRVPPALHEHLARIAEIEGCSMNTLMVALLAGASCWQAQPQTKAS